MPRYVHYTLNAEPEAPLAWGRATDAGIDELAGSPFEVAPPAPTGRTHGWSEVTLAPPAEPTKLVCVGRNYRAHAAELAHDVPAEPLLFLKPPSALLGHGGAIEYPVGLSELVHHEGELAVIIGRRAKHVPVAEATSYVLGYSLLNDVTARDIQRRENKFTRGKGFDTFAPLGPWVDTDFVPVDQRLTVRVGDEVRQRGRLSEMIFGVPTLIAFVSAIMTLEPGDVIATGTPAGVGPLEVGDAVEVAIEGLGVLENTVKAGGR